ncbi:VWA domain-containing protein [Synoicihabitans lomoniglobus]|uniref:VWA domain-containing protein n=1 Tax=Synoicihabitans lomoniglobus TaxID=2909285 RepID=A0AAF0I3M1_9BACT|nr:VWA domain-containing protein [Opitutaceae bacterium LMO-M01]WED66000.1 VWA domain-containing protein [Opitutaceae bacterium LMO-M01]
MDSFAFQEPGWLGLLMGVPLVAWLRWRRGTNALVVPFAAAWFRPGLSPASPWPSWLAVGGIVLAVLALARPQVLEGHEEVLKEGYDIMLAIDLSGSMLAEDYERAGQQLNRLEAIKPVIKAFIADRPDDRIGLIVFAGRAYTLAPPTFDHEWLARQTEKLKIGLMEDGTAIGDGLGMALARLDHGNGEMDTSPAGAEQASSAFVVLLTDGSNNHGALKPMQAAAIAAARRVPVYTIGAGKEGTAPFPIFDSRGQKTGYRRIVSDLDENALRQISAMTSGQFYRADSSDTVAAAFAAIDANQKVSFQARAHLRARDLFAWFMAASIGITAVGALASRLPGSREVIV